MTTNESIIKTLKELGFKPQKYDKGLYRFYYEGHLFYSIYEKDDPEFFAICMPCILEVNDKIKSMIDMLQRKLSDEMKFIKAHIMDDQFMISFQCMLVGGENLKVIIENMIKIVFSAYEYAISTLVELIEKQVESELADESEEEEYHG